MQMKEYIYKDTVQEIITRELKISQKIRQVFAVDIYKIITFILLINNWIKGIRQKFLIKR